MGELDLCAATLVNKLVKKSRPADSAVTHKAEFTFHGPSYAGDVIYMEAEVVELRHKAIKVKVESYREPRDEDKRYHVATSTFVFVTRKGDKYINHNLTMEDL